MHWCVHESLRRPRYCAVVGVHLLRETKELYCIVSLAVEIDTWGHVSLATLPELGLMDNEKQRRPRERGKAA